MSLNLDGWVTPEQSFKGLYELGDKMERRNEKAEFRKQQDAARKSASDKYFTNYLDPKDRFTGTMLDPIKNELLGSALKQAYELSSKGANDNEILAAIQPLVYKVNQYEQVAKASQQKKKEALDVIKNQKGFDLNKFNKEWDDVAFLEDDAETGEKRMKDLNQFNPDAIADKVLKERDIYNNEGFDEYVAKSGKNTVSEDVSIYNRDRSMRRTKVDVTKPAFMISDVDERGAHVGFVPKFELATDGENVLLHKFLGDDGKETEAPVRIVTDDVFNDQTNTNKAYLRQEARRFAKMNNIPLNSPQVENFAKALAYDELKNSGKQYSSMKEIQVQKAAPAPITRITVNNNSGGNDPINDVYKDIDDVVNNTAERISEKYSGQTVNGGKTPTPATLVNDLNVDGINQIVKVVKDAGHDKLSADDLFLHKKDDGRISIYRKTDEGELKISKTYEVGILPRVGTNIGRQANVKGKAAVVAQGNTTTLPPATPKSNQTLAERMKAAKNKK